jgi:nucleoside-diphosphate-sugar epimerase
MALYVVTGGAGFIGSHLVEALLERGEQVRVFDDFSTGKQEHLAPFADRIEIIEGDLCHLEQVRRAVAGADYVLHQGALRSVPRSVDNPVASNDVNVGGTLNVLHAAKEAGVRRVVSASSSSVYGKRDDFPLVEDAGELEPMSPYAVSKLAGEKYCKVFTELYGLETVSLRYFNVFGPKMDPNSAYAAFIAIFAAGLLEGRKLTIHGDGTISRDWTYIDNVVDANLRAASAPDASGEALNIACGDSWDLNRVIDKLRELIGVDGEVEFGPPRAGDMPKSQASIEKAKKLLGYEPLVQATEGLERTVDWYRQQETLST